MIFVSFSFSALLEGFKTLQENFEKLERSQNSCMTAINEIKAMLTEKQKLRDNLQPATNLNELHEIMDSPNLVHILFTVFSDKI